MVTILVFSIVLFAAVLVSDLADVVALSIVLHSSTDIPVARRVTRLPGASSRDLE